MNISYIPLQENITLPDYNGIPPNIWYTIHSVALCVNFCSIVGSIFVIIQQVKLNRKRTLVLIHRFPMYVSIADALLSLFHSLDHSISLYSHDVSQGELCVFLGWCNNYTLTLPTFWTVSCGFYMLLQIGLHKNPHFGPGDWALHVFNWGIPFAIQMVALSQGEFGPEEMWCGLPNKLWEYNSLIIIVGYILTTILFTGTLPFMRRQSGAEESSAVSPIPKSLVVEGSTIEKMEQPVSTPHNEPIPDPIQQVESQQEKGDASNSGRVHPIISDMEKSTEQGGNGEPAAGINNETSNHNNNNSSDHSQAIASQVPQARNPQLNENLNTGSRRLLLIFIIIYIFQWAPYIAYVVLLKQSTTFFELNIVEEVAIYSGGIWKAVAYKFWLKKIAS